MNAKSMLVKMYPKLLFLIVIFFGVNSCFGFTPRFQVRDRTAKTRFCSQKYFDSLSFDGESYKFTVNRKVINHISRPPRYTFEVFKLRYNSETDSFAYNSSTFDHDNLVQLGGIYIDKLKIYVEFYKNLSSSAATTKKVSYCPYYQIPHFIRHNCTRHCGPNVHFSSTPQTVLNLCDWRYLDQPCIRHGAKSRPILVRPSIFSQDVSNYLKSGKPCTFVYDPNSEKIMYIFSDKDTPMVINSLRTVTSANNINWFTKDIGFYRMYKFVGAFNWPTVHSSTIYLMAQSNWTRHNSVLLELTSTGKFVLSKPISWQTFFGCHRTVGHSQLLRAEKQGATSKGTGWLNAFTISILLLMALAVVLVLFALVQNIDFSRIKHCFKRFTSTF